MTLEAKVMESIKTAMKARDKGSLRALRAIKAAILLQQTSGSDKPFGPEEEIKLLQKLVKQRKDSLAIFESQGRQDLANTEAEEIAVIETFLPEKMDVEDLKEVLQAIITETGASSMKDMGKVMGIANQRLMGKADGKTIAQIVKAILG